jgi:hypothetical protein
MEKELPVIYGIMDNQSPHGVQAFALDPQDETILNSHFCSSEGFAKSDLGFSGPLFEYMPFTNNQDKHSTVYFNEQVHKDYAAKYPDGYRMQWMGNWNHSEHLSQMLERAYHKKYPTDVTT